MSLSAGLSFDMMKKRPFWRTEPANIMEVYSMNKRPVLFDSDPGIDDFFAWMLLQTADQFELKAVTTVPGNATLEAVTRNALGIAKLLHTPDSVRVAAGSPRHMLRPLELCDVHGPTGLGTLNLEGDEGRLCEKHAWDVLYEEAVKAEGRLEIVAVGPLTNLGIAFFKYPNLPKMIKQITVMGGSTGIGNMTPFGEANIVHDPHAAAIVFSSGVPITMVGLNALPPCRMTKEQMEELMPANLNPQIREVCLSLAEFRQGIPLCDAITVAALLDEKFAEFQEFGVDIETRSPVSEGMTVVDMLRSKEFFADEDVPNKVRVAMNTDAERYFALFRNMFCHYCC